MAHLKKKKYYHLVTLLRGSGTFDAFKYFEFVNKDKMSISIFATFASDQFYQSTKVEIIWCKRMFFNEIKKHSPKTLIANLQSVKQDIILPRY